MKKYINKKSLIIFLLIIVSVIISVNFKSNVWNKNIIGIDSSVFISIANKMHEGLIPYKNIFDHKGPLIYLINYVGTILPGYFLLYCIELTFLIFDLIIAYKIANYLIKNDIASCLVSIFSISNIVFVLQGGNFTEEYALPFILLALYIFIKSDKNFKDYLISGVALGAVCMLRINMIAIWVIGYLFITVKLLYQRRFKEWFNAVAFSVLGLLIAVMPFILYLICNNALLDFIKQYIMFNLLYSSSIKTSLVPIIEIYIKTKYLLDSIFIINIYLLIKAIKEKNKFDIEILLFSITYFCLSFFTVAQAKRIYWHYMIIMIPCYIIPIAYTIKLIKNKGVYNIIIIVTLIITMLTTFSCNIADFKYSSELYIVSKYIKDNTSIDSDVLVLGNKCLIYLLSERTTRCKYIYQFPPCTIDQRIKSEVREYITNSKPDVIVYTQDINDYYYDILMPLVKNGEYDIVNEGYCVFTKVRGEKDL